MTVCIMTRNYDGGLYAVALDTTDYRIQAESQLYLLANGWHQAIAEMTATANKKQWIIAHIDGFLPS